MVAMTSGTTAGISPPKTASELAKTKRGALPVARAASSRARVPSTFTRMLRSKSCSDWPLSTAARW